MNIAVPNTSWMPNKITTSDTEYLFTKQRLTVVQVVPRLIVGGVERGTVEFAIYLKKRGHKSIVISSGGEMVKQLVNAGVEHIELEVAAKSLKTLKTITKLRHIIKKNQVDVVHARSRIPAWLCLRALKKNQPKPLFVTTLHGLHSVNRYSSVMARGDRVIAVSKVAKQYLQQHFQKYLKQEPTVIYRGIDQQFSAQHQVDAQWLKQIAQKHPQYKKVKKVLLPGRLTAVKGVEHVLPWLLQAPENVKLVLTAEPDQSSYSKKVTQKINQLGLENKVIWLGTISHMPDLYATVDVVISVNNKPESFGRTVLEALSMGIPVVAFDLGGVGEVMQQLFPGGLIPAGDTQALIAKVNQFLSQPPSVDVDHNFHNALMFEKTLALYQKALVVST